MDKENQRPTKSLQKRIHSFCGSMILMILMAGTLFGGVFLRSNQIYRDGMMQMTEIQELKMQITTVGELVQNRIVNGEENLSECISAWTQLSHQIQKLELLNSGDTLRLLAEDLQAYQRNTESDFYNLVQNTEQEKLQESFRRFLIQQEDRRFLCDQLLKYLTGQMADTYEVNMRENTRSLLLFALSMLCLLVLAGFFAFTFAEDVYRPIQRLTTHAESIMEGDYQMDDLPVEQEDEIGQLTETFNSMKNRVRENFYNQEELWRVKSLLQDAEFRALQSQVNPHFLFNVLSVATEAALLENADRTVDIIEHISYMLHYGLTSVRDNSWLSEELQMVQSYLFLQKERFGDRITFLYSISEDVPVIRIPGMTLQPIVENAVKHGVERMVAGGKIEITMQQTESAVEICVKDNGVGIPMKQVEALNCGEGIRNDSGNSTGLGFANVYGRMEAFYQQKGLLWVESREGEGTRVFLKYLIQEESRDASGIDC